ncbi:MAG: TraR/DksA family transcriptional regulator [Proteobacteria bacterium]|nr:TraR/DksA family transcriptional regulator [Pseudomonadota bacterium]MBU1648226.1 TraR/DksA family transcriptional regulator [Pseudomonadota bacterium]
MDVFDKAQEIDAQFTRQAIEAALPPKAAGESAEICSWCDRVIPEKRREAMPGCQLCAECQEIKERLPGGR